jgi:hypothetical protein
MRTAGPLRHRVTLQKPVEAEEATYGDIGETWTGKAASEWKRRR